MQYQENGDLFSADTSRNKDYTATTILSKFQNEAAGRSVERVLEKLSKKKAAEILAVGASFILGLVMSAFLDLISRTENGVFPPILSFPPISLPSVHVCSLPFPFRAFLTIPQAHFLPFQKILRLATIPLFWPSKHLEHSTMHIH
jgi:hypothetical protein